jgi:hypothetical protein
MARARGPLLALAAGGALLTGLVACGGSDREDAMRTASGTKAAGDGESELRRPQRQSRTTGRGVPLMPGGDNSIQTFGSEAPSAERRLIWRLAQSYLDARTAGRWAEACPHLTAELKRRFAELARGAPRLRRAGCGAILAAVHRTIPESIRAQRGPIGMASVRLEDDLGFAIYRAADGAFYSLPIVREGRNWKVAAVDAGRLLDSEGDGG